MATTVTKLTHLTDKEFVALLNSSQAPTDVEIEAAERIARLLERIRVLENGAMYGANT